MSKQEFSLADRFDLTKPQVLLNGTQALVRLMLMQAARDKAARLNTAGFVTGYRGSPLGGVDLQMMREGKRLGEANILFQPGLNEDLAATAIWGSQQIALHGGATRDGAFGISSALIYPPGSYATTDELVEVAEAMAPYGGVYITHMRSEADRILEAMDEAIRIGREAGVPVEIFHLKPAGRANWGKHAAMLAKIDSARRAGLDVQADMYPYTAGATGLTACLPPWTLDGGYDALFKRLQDPATREKIKREVTTPTDEWENLYLAAGTPERIILASFNSEKLKPLTGKSLAEVAKKSLETSATAGS